MKKPHWFLAGIMVLAVLLAIFYVPALTRYHNLKLQEDEIDTKLHDLDQKIKTLVEERDLLKNDRDYLEKVIRQELGLVKPGEIIYKFITEPAKKKAQPHKDMNSEAEESPAGVQGSKPSAVPASPPPASLSKTSSKIQAPDKVENPPSQSIHEMH